MFEDSTDVSCHCPVNVIASLIEKKFIFNLFFFVHFISNKYENFLLKNKNFQRSYKISKKKSDEIKTRRNKVIENFEGTFHSYINTYIKRLLKK